MPFSHLKRKARHDYHTQDMSLMLLITLVIALVFICSCFYPFLNGWDDDVYVLSNTGQFTFTPENIFHWFVTPVGGCWLPLTMISYMIDFNAWDLCAAGWHLQNLFWHIAAALAAFKIMRHFGINSYMAVFAVMAFAVHPQRVESVVWIAERKDTMCAAFYLWSLFFYLDGSGGPKGRRWSLAFFILALLSKSMAVSLPFVLLLSEAFYTKKYFSKNTLKKLAPFFLLALLAAVITLALQPPRPESELLQRIPVAIRNTAWYILKTAVPSGLCPIYPQLASVADQIPVIIFFFLIAGVCGAGLYSKNPNDFKYTALPIALAYLISLAPVSGIIMLGSIDYADRYSYLPSFFLWLGLAAAVNMWIRNHETFRRRFEMWSGMTGALYILLLSSMTMAYARTWSDYRTVLEAAVVKPEKPNYMAAIALCNSQFNRGDYLNTSATADIIISLPENSARKKDEIRIKVMAACLKGAALFNSGATAKAARLMGEISSMIDGELFRSPETYAAILKIKDDCQKLHPDIFLAGQGAPGLRKQQEPGIPPGARAAQSADFSQ